MAQSKSIRLEIEHEEFPRSPDGYERSAVDRHLRAVAELVERRADGDASWDLSLAMAEEVRRVGETAGARVQEIVAVAERSGAAIVDHAEAQASAIVERAQESAETIRRRALEHAAAVREGAEREAQEAQARAHAETEQLEQAIADASTLLERLGSAGALVGELSTPTGEASAGAAGRGERVGRFSPDGAGAEDEPASEEDSESRSGSTWLSRRWLMGEPIRRPVSDGDEAGSATLADGEAGRRRELETYTVPKLRVAAFSGLMRGSAREEVADHLRESFDLTEDDDDLLEAALDEAALSAGELRSAQSPIANGTPRDESAG